MGDMVIQAKSVVKTFYPGEANEHCVLNQVNLDIAARDRVAIIGPSGSGKSTLLHCLSGIDTLSSGSVLIAGQDVAQMDEQQRAEVRNSVIGFIFQDHHLLPHCTVLENVLLPCLAFSQIDQDKKAWAQRLLEILKLADRGAELPQILSGGERQRVAVARALIMKPQIIIADEPTGSLDRDTAIQVAELLDQLQEECACALMVVTHDDMMAQRMQRVVRIEQGALIENDQHTVS